jgi:excisionase family DNA binding protein
MNISQRTDPSALGTVNEIAEETGVSPFTLHRLCQSGLLRCEVGARGWLVRRQDVDEYVRSRLPTGTPNVTLIPHGEAPRGYHDSGAGWRFRALRADGTRRSIHIWFSDQLIKLLQQDHHDVAETVQRAATNCVADSLLVSDELSDGLELLYGSPDRAFILHAAGKDR